MKKSFKETVSDFREFKKRKTGHSVVTKQEYDELREAHFSKENRVRESSRRTTSERTRKSYLKDRRNDRLDESRKSYLKDRRTRTEDESNKERPRFRRALNERTNGRPTTKRVFERNDSRNYKISDAVRTMNESEVVSKVKPNTNKVGKLSVLIENYRSFKELTGKGNKVTLSELSELKEAFKAANGRLREADDTFDVAAQVQPEQPMQPEQVADAAVAEPGVQVDPNLMNNIMNVVDSVDSLSVAAGIEDQAADMAAEPEADIPAITGEQPTQEEVAPIYEKIKKEFMLFKRKNSGISKITESERKELYAEAVKITAKRKLKESSTIDRIKEKIARREERISKMMEDKAAQSVGAKVLNNVGPKSETKFNYGDRSVAPKQGTNPDSQLKTPTAAQIAKGVDGGKGTAPGKVWPTTTKTVGALQGKNASNSKMKESLNRKINKSAQEVTDAYVNKELSDEKLDFKSITKSLSKGFLG